MLVSRRVLHNGGRVNAGFGRKCAFADIRRGSIGRSIEPLVERVRNVGKFFERGIGHSDVEACRELRLEFQSRNDGDQIGIAATLAKAVERALYLTCAGSYRGKRI